MGIIQKVDLDWKNLGFAYLKTDLRFMAHYRDGTWSDGALTEDNHIHIHEGSTAIHYGQQAFEGLKAYTTKDGRILIFRPDQNAKRLRNSALDVMMPPVPEELFLRAVQAVVRANLKWVPPYGLGASFYLRPYLIGVGQNMGVRPAPEYHFGVFGCPVGAYFKSGLAPVRFITSARDRAAPHGTGQAKVGGNYAASLLAHEQAVKAGYADCIYLDPLSHSKIEEVGAANFFGITRDGKFVTPKSDSILPSITKYSLMEVAQKYLSLPVEESDVSIYHLDEFAEAGACGTAAVITPIGGITHNGREHLFGDGKTVGPVTRKLYDTLTGIQYGDVAGPSGWMVEVDQG
ncbi:MAG: branched chain amino acid aminotransferase [Spirochaetes bacterium GWD1_61_31]|nr:MAG: branched chain amino acid aminotransferase [Spirochaetes bacterium GWB1_60_80]OHD34231.1 MAG: branched chain amino acid aminotransferase [Spirochaetes bacterium GWC1_61_12]OHD40159.1 MAG: branched chain amino acid aminotransferase [Spirochaetes bacterium GWD1_61_31]OHD45793.1 MAG: branched chain amino acid aminotransferase [Spirochaetes bacterium GWE1_60_18]OHD58336.1 MAG: branched chain amino acid aminotransferase [Spirochaetes bacterium GWF1_60_12]HAW86333.1 branched chain amino acid